MAKQKIDVPCQNVFQSNDSATRKKQYNQKWVEVINQMEKSKQ